MSRTRLLVWHRTVGIIAVLFIVLLAATGLLLNHTGDLQLDHRYVESDWLLSWYAIEPGEDPVAYPADGHWITRIDNRLYFDDRELPVAASVLSGAVAVDAWILAAVDGGLLLLNRDGELIEKLSVLDGTPEGIDRIGADHGGAPAIGTPAGVFLGDPDLENWSSAGTSPDPAWSVSATLPTDLRAALLRLYRGRGVTLERLLLDLHSGRILGAIGVVIVDLAALMFLVLSISGAWAWMRRKAPWSNGSSD